jgi:hypothetical protein
MTEIVPIDMRWNGKSLVPLARFVARATQQYVVDAVYRINVELDRSEAEHRYFFAAFHEAWVNMPSDITESFEDEKHFRSWCLVNCGYVKGHYQYVVYSNSELSRFLEFLKKSDNYAIVIPKGNVINVYTAKSQSHRSMSKTEFHKSATDVLEFVAALIGLTADELKANAGKAA